MTRDTVLTECTFSSFNYLVREFSTVFTKNMHCHCLHNQSFQETVTQNKNPLSCANSRLKEKQCDLFSMQVGSENTS